MTELNLLPADNPHPIGRVLKAAALGTVLASAVIAPNILSLWGLQLDRRDRKASPKTLRAIRYARSQGWLTLRETNRGVEIALTKSGRIKWRALELERPLTAGSWDGKWRLVLFDIPLSKRSNADAFRSHLKRIGFRQLQKSVWVIPYPCSAQVAALRQLYALKNNVRLVEAIAIDNEASLKTQFRIR